MARSAYLFLLLVAGARAAEPVGQASFEVQVKPLLQSHCLECHGAQVQEAGLRLDTLAIDLEDETTMATWIRLHDKLRAGEMPPPGSPRPPQRAIDAATRWLKDALHTASLDRQQRRGRVLLRRLNATEYENTIRDLLGSDVPLKDLLPEETSVAGFDNVSAALDLSATHLLLYQEAAEQAIASVIPPRPPVSFSDRRTGKEMTEKGPNFRQTLSRSCRLEGNSLVFYSKLPRYGLCSTAAVPMAGRYRVQMSIAAVGGAGKPVPAAFLTVGTGREDPVVQQVRDIPPGEPTLIEIEIDLQRRQAFVVNLLTSWDIRAFKRPIEEYTGPGLRVDWISIAGPVEAFPPERYHKLFAGVPLKPRSVAKAESDGTRIPKIAENRSEYSWLADPLVPAAAQPKQDAERLIRAFVQQACRRPVSEELQSHFVTSVHQKLDEGYSFSDAMTYGYKGILTSPHFLLFIEPAAATSAAGGNPGSPQLDDYAIANRLSYFLWSTLPDDELLAAAGRGDFTGPESQRRENLRAQVERMLASPKSRRFTENFTGQWLDLRQIDATIPDPQLYGDFDGLLLWAMPRETQSFFEEVLRKDLSLLEFIDSDWTMLNERLAAHYGISGVEGNALRKVKLPPGSHRGGVMTQASVLKVTADGTRTSPVLRGKWVLERLLGQSPPPPPPDVPAIEPDIRGATTIRQQLDKHRNVATCASCHVHIDPPGFALEQYDPIGGFREFYRVTSRTPAGVVQLPNYTGRAFYRGPNVEKGGLTHDGRSFADIDEYKRLLLEDQDQLARSLTQKLLIYATGADLQFADRQVVEQIVGTLRTKRYGFRTLIHEVVQSRVFLNK